MEPATNPDTQKKEEEVFDLGNFSDYDENEDQDACGGDNNHKSKKDPSKKNTCTTDANKTCRTECQNIPAAEPIDADRLCKKCKEKKGTLKYRSDTICKECYLSALGHRFRTSMRLQVKLAKKDDEVLCCLSGGQNSLAMCKLISESLHNPGPRKMFFNAQMIHINEAASVRATEQEEEQNVQKINKFAEQHKLKVTIINLEDIYDLKTETLEEILVKSYGLPLGKADETAALDKAQKREKLQNLLNSLSDTGSSKEDLLFVFKKLLIADFASRNNIQKILFADTAQKVAINSLTLLCKGRGADLFNQVLPEDKTFSNATIYRPMNDFLTREVLIYDYFNKMDEFYVIYPKLEDFAPANKRLPGNGSINTLLENFVDKLQAGFPSTVHTVLNTLNKIKPKMDEKKICPICWGKKDKLGNILEKGSIIQYLKPQGKEEQIPSNKGLIDMDYESKKIKDEYLSSEYFQAKNNFEKIACFSCGRIFENAKDQTAFSENLPGFIKNSAQNICSQTMPKSINQKAYDYYFYDNEGEL